MTEHKNRKSARNKEIKQLVKDGKSQIEVGKMYGITQSRVNAILNDRMPPYRYCNHCRVRITGSIAVCDECRAKTRKIAEDRKRENDISREQHRIEVVARREERQKMLEENRRIRSESMDDFSSSKSSLICTICGKYLMNGVRRICEDCKDRKNLKQRCVFCEVHTDSRWKVCLQCVPYRDQCSLLYSGIRLEGRDVVRSLVRARDRHTCQNCGLVRLPQDVQKHNRSLSILKGKMKSLDVHHLNGQCGKNSIGYDKAEEIPNLITLCHSCHFNHPEHTFQTVKVINTSAEKDLAS